ncbi:hypothetical protein [Micromonospora sp. SH-82]|uniref:hypothetical protein n=1 Tax=Micromonospora sp. SH-82 TaxID=3132938 RepID=UPI003EB79129
MLTVESVEQMAAGYAPAPDDHQLDHQLKRRRLVCLSGTVGTGRYTTACLASARDRGADRVGVLGVDHLVDLLRPDGPIRHGHGHVLELDEAKVRELDGLTLIGLASRMETKNSTLILIGEFGSRTREVAEYLVEHRAPSTTEVFRVHLRQRLRGRCVRWCKSGCQGDCAESYVERLLEHPLLTAHLAGECRTVEVVRLVEALDSHVIPETRFTEWLERWLPSRLRARATRILSLDDGEEDSSAVPPDQRRAFRIACAVLAGQPVTEMYAAAQRLSGAGLAGPPLVGQPDAPVQPPSAPVFAGSIRAGLDVLLGPTLRQVVQTVDDRDPSGGRRLDFTPGNEVLRAPLLEAAWSDWWLPDQFLGWLADLVRSESPGVRQAAAGAIGLSARHSVHAALHTVDRLARERRAGVRQAAAIALVAMAMQSELRQPIRAALDEWAAGGAAYLRDTVARAYALGLARIWPDIALLHLRLVAQVRGQRWHNSVVRGLVEVYSAGHAATVLPVLTEWTASEDTEVRLHAARALRVLADRSAASPFEHWPELLNLTRDGTVRLDDLATCWVAALSIPQTGYRAWRTLGYWLSLADGQPELSALLLRMLGLVMSGEAPLRRRLAHQLDHVWVINLPRTPLLADVRRLTAEGTR